MRRLLTVLVLVVGVSAVATGVLADEITYVGPGQPTGNVWANYLNWHPLDHYPGAGDIAYHDYAEEDSRGWILMNAPHSPSTPWPVDEFRAIGDWDPQEPGALILEGYCDRWMPSVCDGDHIRWIDAKDGASSSVLNGYEIYVGPKDAFVVGNPFPGQTPNPNARADNFSWVLHGEDTNPAWVVSPAGFGPGRWNIDAARMQVQRAVNPDRLP
jgi:hypothetical protein